MDSHRVANRRPYERGTRALPERPARPRWSPLAMTSETVRALPVVIPVGIVGRDLHRDCGRLAGAGPARRRHACRRRRSARRRDPRRGLPASDRRRQRRRDVARNRLDRLDGSDLRLARGCRRRLHDDGARRARPTAWGSPRHLQHRPLRLRRHARRPFRRERPRRQPGRDRGRAPASARPRSTRSTWSFCPRSLRGLAASEVRGVARPLSLLDDAAVPRHDFADRDADRALEPLAVHLDRRARAAHHGRAPRAVAPPRTRTATRVRPAQGRVHRGHLTRVAHAAHVGVRRRGDAAEARRLRRDAGGAAPDRLRRGRSPCPAARRRAVGEPPPRRPRDLRHRRDRRRRGRAGRRRRLRAPGSRRGSSSRSSSRTASRSSAPTPTSCGRSSST